MDESPYTLINMDEAVPAQPGSLQTNRGGSNRIHMYARAHALKQGGMHKHIFFIITMLSTGGQVGLCYSAVYEVGCH